jgi:hypothetical protein
VSEDWVHTKRRFMGDKNSGILVVAFSVVYSGVSRVMNELSV